MKLSIPYDISIGNICPTQRAQMKGEVKGAKEIEDELAGKEQKKQQYPPFTFTKLRKSVDKSCIIILER